MEYELGKKRREAGFPTLIDGCLLAVPTRAELIDACGSFGRLSNWSSRKTGSGVGAHKVATASLGVGSFRLINIENIREIEPAIYEAAVTRADWLEQQRAHERLRVTANLAAVGPNLLLLIRFEPRASRRIQFVANDFFATCFIR